MRKQLSLAAALVVVGLGALLCRDSSPQSAAQREVPLPPLLTGPTRATTTPLPTLQAADSGATVLDLDALAARPASLVANGRTAWLLSELVAHDSSERLLHAITTDGKAFPLNRPDRVLVVRRASGELYIGWLEDGAEPSGALADIERPAERIENLARITLEPLPQDEEMPPAQLTVLLDGKVVHTLGADNFAGAATAVIRGHDSGTQPAIDVERAFGQRLAGLVADGVHVEAHAPVSGARGVIYMNRRSRFKFAWVDKTGAPLGAKRREVSQLALITDR